MHIRAIAVAAAKSNAIHIIISLAHYANGKCFGVVIVNRCRVNNIGRHPGSVMFCLTAISVSRINPQTPVGWRVLFTEGNNAVFIVS